MEGEGQAYKVLRSTALTYAEGLVEYLEGGNDSLLTDKIALSILQLRKKLLLEESKDQ